MRTHNICLLQEVRKIKPFSRFKELRKVHLSLATEYLLWHDECFISVLHLGMIA